MKKISAAETLREKLAELIPLRHYILTGYARNGLILLLKALQWSGPDEIIIPAFTCPVIRHTIAAAGLVPVPVDAEENGINIDPEKIKAAITERTKAIYVVHTYGMAARIDAICALAKNNGLFVIEDLAHGPFSTYRGKALGTYGDAAVLSFTKKTVNFEGGAIGTNNSALYARMAMLQRESGSRRPYSPAFFIEIFVRLVGSWWESTFSPIALILMKLNDAINAIIYKGSYGISIEASGYFPTEIGCRITLRQIERLFIAYRDNKAKYLERAEAATDLQQYRPHQKDPDTKPFYLTGIPVGRRRLYRLLSFRTWRNSNRPGAFPRADYLYGNYRIFSRAVYLFLPRRKNGPVHLIHRGDLHKKNMKQPPCTKKRGII
ncbi:MAG: DegT/DnrJ/EryC1/StrS family aminotransferase [Spirochaetes bacterium]|nr:DegT/DnrJ/EryC1/StrS family aminotransferase [Spirochaetota bacterium]